MNELTLQTFKEKLNIFYSKDNGQKEIETAVEEFSKFAIAQNKENNPFFYGELLSAIKHTQIPLSELKNPNSSVVKEVIVQATKKAIILKEKIEINNQIKIQAESNLKENVVQKSYEEKLEERRKVDETIEKYGGFKEFLHQATKEEIDKYIEVRKEQKILNDEIEAFIIAIRDSELLTEKQNEMLTNSKLGKECGYNAETREFKDKEKAEDFLCQWEIFSKEAVDFKELNPDKTNEEILDMLKEDPQFALVFEMGYQGHIIGHMEQVFEERKTEDEKNQVENATEILVDGEKVSIDQDELVTLFADIKLDDGLNITENNKIRGEYLDNTLLQAQLEAYFDFEFLTIPNPALLANIELKENVQSENNFTEMTAEEPVKEELEEATQEQPEEPDYKSPTIEVDDKVVEKKGLAKWLDRLKQSRNPLARLITGQLGKKQDNLLNAADTQKTETNYENKPSAGRFDVTDTQLMPDNTTGPRNTVIQFMEKLFRGNKEVAKEPEKTPVPISVNSFDVNVKVGKDIKERIVTVGIAAGENKNEDKNGKEASKIVPQGNKIFGGNTSKEGSEGPSLDD